MPSVELNDIDYMREAVFFDGPDVKRKLSRFWILLVLASVIAGAGVVADSTATVIGAMIVAPLMTPILGTMLGVVLGDRANLVRSILLVLAGAAAAILIGYTLGLGISDPVTAATNSQVAGRVNPRLIDLIAALATGAVGSVALVRRDISDTLPGVAIAISLVPPLSVVGLTAESGAWDEAWGAFFLFSTNVAAILTTGIIVMALFKVYQMVTPASTPEKRAINRRNAVLVIVAFFAVILVPLISSARRIADDNRRQSDVRAITQEWADSVGWEVLQVATTGTDIDVVLIGSPPIPETASYAEALNADGIDPETVIVEFIPRTVVQVGSEDQGLVPD
jgi:uncharacterized hydrophobic protein (TIGR00271 family)